MEDLEPPIRAMLDATNAADSQAFLGVAVTGNGYNGGGSFIVDVDRDRITRLEITG
jgi:hypothetical protein